jgi:hypothetical protein
MMTVPGIGPIRGRDYSTWLGLVPKQMSIGDRAILGRISKRGNGYLRKPGFQSGASGLIIVSAEGRPGRFRPTRRFSWRAERSAAGGPRVETMYEKVNQGRLRRHWPEPGLPVPLGSGLRILK